MFYPFPRPLLTLSVVISIFGTTSAVSARPASVFTPEIEQIQRTLPLGLTMRLPSEFRLNEFFDIDPSRLVVRSFPSDKPRSFTVSVFTCTTGSQPCLLGSFSVEEKSSASAQLELNRHREKGDRITLATNIRGYFLEGQQQSPFSSFSSVMWQQDNLIYTVSFPSEERQNLLLMAASMAREMPLRRRV